jgi:hypothetical protein
MLHRRGGLTTAVATPFRLPACLLAKTFGVASAEAGETPAACVLGSEGESREDLGRRGKAELLFMGADLLAIEASYFLIRQFRAEVCKNMQIWIGDAPRFLSYKPPRGLCEHA